MGEVLVEIYIHRSLEPDDKQIIQLMDELGIPTSQLKVGKQRGCKFDYAIHLYDTDGRISTLVERINARDGYCAKLVR